MRPPPTKATRQTFPWYITALVLLALAAFSVKGISKDNIDVLDFAIALSMDEQSSQPIDRTDQFLTTDERVYCWVHLGSFADQHRVQFKWFYPDGELCHQSDPGYEIGASGQTTPGRVVWTWLPIRDSGLGRRPGVWSVDVLVDGEALLSQEFSILTLEQASLLEESTDTEGPLRLTLILLQSDYECTYPVFKLGEPIVCIVALTNKSPLPLFINKRLAAGPVRHPFKEISYRILDQTGDAMSCLPGHVLIFPPSPEDLGSLDPGNFVFTIDTLNARYPFEEAGIYSIQAVYQNTFDSEGELVWRGRIGSNTVHILVEDDQQEVTNAWPDQ